MFLARDVGLRPDDLAFGSDTGDFDSERFRIGRDVKLHILARLVTEGIGVTLEVSFEGFTQRAPTTGATGNADSLYITSSNGTVLQLLPGGRSWQILTPAP